MPNIIALSPAKHSSYSFSPRDGYHFAKQQSAVPILLAELNRVLPQYPIAFLPENDQYTAVAITGDGKRNLYINNDGKWLGEYVPSALRGYPFAIANNKEGQGIFCIHEEHLHSNTEHQPLFTDNKELSAEAKQHLDFLTQCEGNRQQTSKATAALAENNLLVPWTLTIDGTEDNPQRIGGLYRIDEEALNQLPAEQLAALRPTGALALAYAQLFSMTQHTQLSERIKYHVKHSTSVGEEDIAKIFARNDDILKF